MKLNHLTLDQLKLSTVNVRRKGGKEIADLLPSIRSLGIIQPLLVRPNCEGFEIVAGQRRFHALVKLATEEGYPDAVPCIVMEDGDDAKAIEASLAENVARLPMDEIDQYKAFAALKAEGLDNTGIARLFGITERLVDQRLAIAGIIEPILNAYRKDEIGAETLRVLTMATAKQQKAWWKLYRSEEDYAPQGRALREWLLGGASIPVSNALFDVEQYTGVILSDLFGAERYFSDAEAFWQLQNAAIAERRDAYLEAGWGEVVILDVGDRFHAWNHVKTPKRKGGKVFIAITHDGEVGFHEGYITEKEARKRDKATARAEGAANDDGREVPVGRPEVTKAMRNYLGLHRHAAVRTELLAHPGAALRLAVAHMIGGSSLWRVQADPQRADSDAIRASLASSTAEAGFAEERKHVRSLLGIEDEADTPIVPRQHDFGLSRNTDEVFARLMAMDDKDVMRVLAFVMAETLGAHGNAVETLGAQFGTDMRQWWQPDEAFFDLLRDKDAINAMVREVAGDNTADAHVASTAKVQKKIVIDCLKGEGRTKVDGWLPRYMQFPEAGYTSRFAPVVRTAALDADDNSEEEVDGDDDTNREVRDDSGIGDEDADDDLE